MFHKFLHTKTFYNYKKAISKHVFRNTLLMLKRQKGKDVKFLTIRLSNLHKKIKKGQR